LTYNAWIYKVVGIRCYAIKTYEVVRFGNDGGPNINIHEVYGEDMEMEFSCFAANGVINDKVNLNNIHSTPAFLVVLLTSYSKWKNYFKWR